MCVNSVSHNSFYIPFTTPTISWLPCCFSNTVEEQFKPLLGRISAEPAYKLSKDEVELFKKAISRIDSNKIAEILNTLEREKLLSCFAQIATANPAQAQALLSKISDTLLLKLSDIQLDEIAPTKERYSHLQQLAVESIINSKGKIVWKEAIVETKHLVHHLIQCFISILGINEIGNSGPTHPGGSDSVSMWEAKSKVEVYLMILTYPGIIFGTVYALVGSTAIAAPITAAILLATAAFIAIYNRYLKPCPRVCEGLTNITEEALRLDNKYIYKREKIHNQIIEAFASGRGALLVGPSGVGKSSIVTSLTRSLTLESKDRAPLTKNAQVFSANAADLTGTIFGSYFNLIAYRFKHHKTEAIFFFDEIAAAFKPAEDALHGSEPQKNPCSDSLKTFIDKCPYVICATTSEEFEKYVKDDKAFNRRYMKIDVSELSEDEVEHSLREHLYQKAPEITMEPGVLQHLIDISKKQKKTSLVHSAHSILSAAINRIQRTSFPTLENGITELEAKLKKRRLSLLQEGVAIDTTEQARDEETLKTLKNELKLAQAAFQKIRKTEHLYCKAKIDLILLSKNANRTWLQKKAEIEVLKRTAEEARRGLNLPVKIDRTLIDEVAT